MSEETLGLAAMAPSTREKLLKQLRVLKRGVGLTPELSGGYTLPYLEYFGVKTLSSAYKLLRTALMSMNQEHLYVQAFVNAYGGPGYANRLSDRRREFAEAHGITESRIIQLEELALHEFVEVLDKLGRGENVRPSESRPVEPSTGEPTMEEVLTRLAVAIEEQNTLLRAITTLIA
ncbi:MAG TPA: hypothetical protein VLG09_04790 [Candidatus Saccharimonadales bacterium]|nr:hypothetical protein [Candidatus Saccharimonadales bacterium]